MRGTTKKSYFLYLFFAIGALLLSTKSMATHLRAGEITVERISCTSLSFKITITVYTNTGSDIRFGEGLLDYGDGSTPHTTPIIENTLRPDLGPEVATVSYSIEHTYGGPGKYVISYLEPNRNAGILNMVNSVETRFYIETEINIDPFLGCSNSPRLLVPPIDKACTGAAWFHNPGAYDPDGDSLSFELAIPKKEKGQFVNGYRDPNAQEFYALIGIDYGTANEDNNGPPTFSIDATTGTIIWDAPGAPGEYNIAFLIKEWRKIQGAWILLGYVTRDMQIIVEDCNNQRPELQVPPDICVEAGTIINQDIFGSDPDLDSVKIEAFSQLFSISPSPATYAPKPATFQSTIAPNQATLTFNWETKCEHIKDQPYQVVFKISDKNNPSLVSFQTWNITVVGPAPTWVDAQVDLGNRSTDLQWDSYPCQTAEIIQVWRRVDSFTFTPPECVTGMPSFLGYKKIAEVPASSTTYRDTNGGKGLAPGAAYCYRLVATFPFPGGGESYVSQEICIPPILADAPVITNVTVDKTANTGGQITVKWRSPFDADEVQFPPPYSFEVLRAQGFSSALQIVKPHPGQLQDSVYVDTDLNTEETIYNYRIIAFDANGTRVDTSATASSVRVEAASDFEQIKLAWAADVPWSNQTQDYPRHLIFRGPAGATESQLVLIDSVDVNENQFTYVDNGQYLDTPLLDTEIYCYRVMTRGSYGNPAIDEPLLNFSQIICAQPNDNVAPCQPELAIVAINCDEYFKANSCDLQQTYSNTIQWKRPADAACRADIRSYNIYKADKIGQPFELYITNVKDTFYIDSNLPSFARCYKVSAVDRSGNESELSEEYCFDNCPYYELPNVFSPNGDCFNPDFGAYGNVKLDENSLDPCGQKRDLLEIRSKCARFVHEVTFTVFDRWGKSLYTYKSGGERSIYIDWDGRDNAGVEVPGGVYFYSADVVFDVVDPAESNKSYKGWVHLIR